MTAWILAVLLLLLGLAGAVLPFLPGPPLILLAAVLHKILLPEYVAISTVVVLTGITLVSALAEAALAWAGAKWLGAGKWGIGGAAAGALIGLFFAGIGMIPGAVIGAALAEWWLAKRTPPEAAKAALGAAVGLLAGRAAQVGLSLVMALLLVLDWFVY